VYSFLEGLSIGAFHSLHYVALNGRVVMNELERIWKRPCPPGGTEKTINYPTRDFNWAFQKYKVEPNGLVSM